MHSQKKTDPRIAIVKLSSMGDVIHALPVLCGLKKQWPRSRISWLVEAAAQDLLKGHEDLEQVIVLDTKTWRRQLKHLSSAKQAWQAITQAKRQLEKCKFDMVLDLQGLIKSGLVTWACKAKTRIGFHPKDCREPLSAIFTNQWVHKQGTHIIEKNLSLLAHLGLDSKEVQYKLPVSSVNRQWAKDWLQHKFAGIDLEKELLVVVHPGTRWKSKCWPVENYVHLIQRLQRYNVKILLSGAGLYEEELIKKINSTLFNPVTTGTTFSLAQMTAILSCCDLMIASDTGPLHLAVALGKPTISFYGPTPSRTGPYGSGHIVLCSDLPCLGCLKKECNDLKCMRAISVEDVEAVVIKQLKALIWRKG